MKVHLITDDAQERRLQDAAHALFDAALSSLHPSTALLGAGQREALAISVAVQAIFLADEIRPGAAPDQRVGRTAESLFNDRLRGVAVGVGGCIGMNRSRSAQDVLRLLVCAEIAQTIQDRNAAGYGAQK